MALGWEVVILFVGVSAALENTQALSQKCLTDTSAFLGEMNQTRPKEYAVQMYDSYGKMGSNVRGGNANQAGMLQQCHSARAPTFSGQYCQVFLRQGTVAYFVGICVPDTCSQEEVKTLVLHEKLQIGQISLIPPLPSFLANESTQEMLMTDCLFKSSTPNASAITCLFMCCLLVAIPLAATLLTAIIKWKRNKEVSPEAESSCLNSSLDCYGTLRNNGSSMSEMNADTLEENDDQSTKQCLRCFPRNFLSHCLHVLSLQTTTQGVFSTSSSVSGKSYASFNGIRVLSLFWVICGHVGHFITLNNLDNLESWKEIFYSNPVYVLSMSGPVFLAVDTFLLLGGLLSAKSLLGAIRRAEDKMSFCLVAKYLINRMKRVQPLHMFILCLTTGPMAMVPRGPFSTPFIHLFHDCKTYWWANILLMTNLFPLNDMCVPWAWYLSMDFQCYMTTPLIVFFYRLNKVAFGVVAGLLLLVTMVISAVMTALMMLPVFMPAVLEVANYNIFYYGKPYTRYGPFLIGILTGIYLTTRTERLLKKKWQAAIGWLLCLALLAALIILSYVLKETPPYPSAPHAIYGGLHRALWAVALTWIIVACEEGYGGFINTFLSWGFWAPLSNISFASYLAHPLVIILHLCLQETPINYSNVNFLYLFLSNLAVTLVVSLLLNVLIEKPYVLLKCGRT